MFWNLVNPGYGPFALNEGAGAPPVYPIDEVGGTAPIFGYGPVKLREAYSGPACRVLRLADNAEQDIGFVGQRLDTVALTAFDPLGTGQILNWYDQSGNGNDSETQATSGLRATISTHTTPSGHRYAYGAGFQYEGPSGTSWDNRATSFYTVHELNYAIDVTSGVFQAGTSSLSLIITSGVASQTGNIATTVRRRSDPVVSELVAGAGGLVYNHGGHERTIGALSAGTVTGFRLGNTTGGTTNKGHYLCYIGYGRALDSTERTNMKAALAELGRLSDNSDGVLVVGGDSIARGANGIESLGFATLGNRLLGRNLRYYNAARSSQQLGPIATANTTLNLFAAGIGTLLDLYTSGDRVFVGAIGTNDITAGARSDTDIYADYVTYAGLVKAKTGWKFIAVTQLPNGNDDAGEQATRASVNASIRANWASFADGLWDPASDPIMGDLTAPSPYYNADKLHPDDPGHAILATSFAAAVEAQL